MIKYVMAIVFSGVPALVAFVVCSLLGGGLWLSVVLALGVFGFGLDVCLRGSDRNQS